VSPRKTGARRCKRCKHSPEAAQTDPEDRQETPTGAVTPRGPRAETPTQPMGPVRLFSPRGVCRSMHAAASGA